MSPRRGCPDEKVTVQSEVSPVVGALDYKRYSLRAPNVGALDYKPYSLSGTNNMGNLDCKPPAPNAGASDYKQHSLWLVHSWVPKHGFSLWHVQGRMP